MPSQPIGITYQSAPARERIGVWPDANGDDVFVTDAPYLATDGRSLLAPVPVFDAPGPIYTDTVGRPMQSWRIKSAAPVVPLVDQSVVYFDQTDAPLGPVTSLTARGIWGGAFTEIAFTGGATAVMEADGLRLNGNILRLNLVRGPLSKITLAIDLTIYGQPTAGVAGTMFEFGPTGGTGRFGIRYDTSYRLRSVGPANQTLTADAINGTGVRQTVATEWMPGTGARQLVEPDGFTQSDLIPVQAFSVARLEIGKGCLAKIHALAVIVEPFA